VPASPPTIKPRYYHGPIIEPDCEAFACPLRGSRKVWPDGQVPAKYVIVGEGPGDNEAREGRAFIGASGKLVWALAAAAGISREEIWVTNAGICLPRKVRLANGLCYNKEEVKALSVRACRRRLLREIIAVTQGDPEAVIVPMGRLALWAMTSLRKPAIYSYRGAVLPIKLEDLLKEAEQDYQVALNGVSVSTMGISFKNTEKK